MQKGHPQYLFNFCPKCGVKTIIFKDNKYFKCKECDFQFFINNAAAVAALILDSTGRLLLCKRKSEPAKGQLDLPGGFVDVEENAESALKREIREELNLKINKLSYFTSMPNHYLYGGTLYYTLDLAFICEIDSFDSIEVNDDISGYVFLQKKDIKIDDIGLDSIKKIVAMFCIAQA